MRALILAGGDRPDRDALDTRFPGWRDVELVVGADAGARHAAPLGLPLHLIVGDFDSLDPAELAAFEAGGVRIEAHPAEKDATDTELALRAGAASGASVLLVVSGGGDRLDHSIGAIMALADPALGDVHVEAWWGTAHIVALRGPRSCRGSTCGRRTGRSGGTRSRRCSPGRSSATRR